MIYVIKNKYNKKGYYRHTCDNCKSELVLETSDICKYINGETSYKSVKCPICKHTSYFNAFVPVSEECFRKYANEKSQ